MLKTKKQLTAERVAARAVARAEKLAEKKRLAAQKAWAKELKRLEGMVTTPDSMIKSAMRLLFMRSRERRAAIRRDKYTCSCGARASTAKNKVVKIEVHHTAENDINWKRIYDVIREELLCDPKDMITLCRPCHYKIHGKTIKE
jgi:hypothetical protein